MRNSSAPGGNFCEQFVAALAGAALDDFGDDVRETLADPGDIGDFAGGVGEDVDDALGDSLRWQSRRCDSCECGTVFAGDLHEVGSFPEHARDFLVLQIGLDLL